MMPLFLMWAVVAMGGLAIGRAGGDCGSKLREGERNTAACRGGICLLGRHSFLSDCANLRIAHAISKVAFCGLDVRFARLSAQALKVGVFLNGLAPGCNLLLQLGVCRDAFCNQRVHF